MDAVQFDESHVFVLFEGRSDLGDVNGDGFTDIAWAIAKEITGDAEYDVCATTLHGGTSLRTGDPDDLLGGIACFDGLEGGILVGGKVGPDADGDGVPDVVFSDTGGTADRAGCIIPSGRMPATGTVLMDEVRPYCFGSTSAASRMGGAIDLDQDGFPELLGTEYSWSTDTLHEAGRILVTPGFDIPWEDASRW
ncbi:MAG: hypothetical protein Q8P41_15905 [Pseudomonadota bacterium]|nr:hypothetical protein [Pseudomonadota bacterium]